MLLRVLDLKLGECQRVTGLLLEQVVEKVQRILEMLQGEPVIRSMLRRDDEQGSDWIQLWD